MNWSVDLGEADPRSYVRLAARIREADHERGSGVWSSRAIDNHAQPGTWTRASDLR